MLKEWILEQVLQGKLPREQAKTMLQELGAAEAKPGERAADIAVIGMACRVAGAASLSEYWNNLTAGKSFIGKLPTERIRDLQTFLDLTNDPDFAGKTIEELRAALRFGAYMSEIDKFDATFFGISEEEALTMDPYQRIMLEVCVEAMEQAGLGGRRLAGTRTGMFIGRDETGGSIYRDLIGKETMLTTTGSYASILASRLSYMTDFRGPAMVVDTACSSGLVALHLACQSMLAGDCDYAFAGGISIDYSPFDRMKDPEYHYLTSDNAMIRTFDKNASGTLWGDGVGVVLLKPLAAAVRDGDWIQAVIKGSAINNDGASNGILAPNAEAQTEVITTAWRRAGIDPGDMSYIECHGTGTSIGDPIEIKGIAQAFRKFTPRKQFCALGAVKPNIGHVLAPSGIMALIKVVLALRHKQIPPSLHFEEPNPHINFSDSPVYVNDELTEWASTKPRLAGLSAFGFSGTNCHVVVEEYVAAGQRHDAPRERAGGGEEPQLFIISAKSAGSFRELLGRYAVWLDVAAENGRGLPGGWPGTAAELANAAFTAATGRGHYGYRAAIVAASFAELRDKLRLLAGGGFAANPGPGIACTGLTPVAPAREELANLGKLASALVAKLRETPAAQRGPRLQVLGQLYAQGAKIDWPALYSGEPRKRAGLPTYPFEKTRYWAGPQPAAHGAAATAAVQAAASPAVPALAAQSARAHIAASSAQRASAPLAALSQTGSAPSVAAPSAPPGASPPASPAPSAAGSAVPPAQRAPSPLAALPTPGPAPSPSASPAAGPAAPPAPAAPAHPPAAPPAAELPTYELSHTQRAIWLAQRFDRQSVAYNLKFQFEFHEQLHIPSLNRALNAIIRRHSVFRTVFLERDGEPRQQIWPEYRYDIEMADLSGEADPRAAALRDFAAEQSRAFDFKKPPIFFKLYKLAGDRYLLTFIIHHLIFDATSVEVLVKEFFTYYETLVSGRELRVEPTRLRYVDWVRQEQQWEQSAGFLQAEQFWLTKLAKPLPVLQLPADFERPKELTYAGDDVSLLLPPQLAAAVKRMAREHRCSLNTYLLACYYALLHKLSGDRDFVVGFPYQGRDAWETEEMIGCFINMISLRVQLHPEMTFAELLQVVNTSHVEAIRHRQYPFELLVRKLNPNRALNRSPIFSTGFFFYHRYDERAAGVSLYDISLNCKLEDDSIELRMIFNTDLFRKNTVQRFLDQLAHLIAQAVEQPQRRLGDAEAITPAEKQQVLHEFNRTRADYPREALLHQRFEAQAAQTPERVAVRFRGASLTYVELNGRANRLARTLRKLGVGPDQTVGMLCERSIELIVGLLAVLKAGGAYVPIDPAYPAERLAYVLEDSGCRWLLRQPGLPLTVPFAGAIVDLNQDDNSEASADLPPVHTPQHLAYVIYTSGSTGKPKGVMVEHGAVVNRLHWMNRRYPAGPNDVVLQKTPYTFDVSVWELFLWTFGGAALAFLEPGGEKDPAEIVASVEREGITLLHFVPSMFGAFLDYVEERQAAPRLAGLQRVFTSGEALSARHVQRFNRLFGGRVGLTNLYGPTEATIDVTYYDCPPEGSAETIPIGKPIDNICMYVVDEQNGLQPVGVPGELCIAGVGVARGYWRRPELTAVKFIANPFGAGKLYRTGDLAKWLPDGNLEYLGRLDHQVKIRGYRIELGEIEQALLDDERVREAVAVAVEAGEDKQLCAYYVAGQDIAPAELRQRLERKLPAYMVPAHLIALANMPLTASGKLDRKQLPQPGSAAVQTGRERVAPRTATEHRLAALWSWVLGVPEEQIGIKDHFFHIGGHSLHAAKLIRLVEQTFQTELPLRVVFAKPSVEEQAAWIGQAVAQPAGAAAIAQVEERPYYPLSSGQKRIFVHHRLEGAGAGYNMPGRLKLQGELDVDRFRQAVHTLIGRHEALRTSFHLQAGEPVQRITPHATIDIPYIELAEEQVEGTFHDFIRPFRLEEAPLLRMCIAKTGAAAHSVLMDMHHIVSDGASISLFIKELMAIYAGCELEPLAIQYKDYAVWWNERLSSGLLDRQEVYWLQTLAAAPPLNVPCDYPRPPVLGMDGAKVSVEAEGALRAALERLGRQQEATLYMVLLAAFHVLLAKYSGQDDIVIGSPVAGREHTDVEAVMGMFVNTLALRNQPTPTKSFQRFLADVKENTLQAFEHASYPFDQLVERLGTPRDVSRNRIVDVMFTLQNLELAGTAADQSLTYSFHEPACAAAKFDLMLEAVEHKDKLALHLVYNTDLFRQETAERLVKHYIAVLQQVTAEPQVALQDIGLLDEAENRLVRHEFNRTQADYPREALLHHAFEAQAAQTPDRVAVRCGTDNLTYGELNRRANRLARTLRKKGVGADQVVGVVCERSLEMIVGIMAILKAGGAYVPIDPGHPADRIAYMLEDSACRLLLAQPGIRLAVPFSGEIYDLQPDNADEDDTNLMPAHSPENLAYVIYTSGSTGRPKGVMVEHGAVVNRLHWMNKRYPSGAGDVILQKTPYTFDVSVWELFLWTFGGATLNLLAPGGEKDPAAIVAAIEREGVTMLHFVPSMFNAFLEYVEEQQAGPRLGGLRQIFTSGEALQAQQVQKFNRLLGGRVRLTNLYGPTEATIDVTYYDCPATGTIDVVPIGKPIDNICLYVIDQQTKLQPVGVPGELCIAGVGVARGYIHKAELTQEKFIANPFGTGKLYRTGDLARWLPDGNIEYLGRIDQQVKIRGYRIEPGEIEARLQQHEAIRRVVVLDRVDGKGQRYLCAYAVVEPGATPTVPQLREHLLQSLPEYMVPASFRRVGEIPLTPSGKTDRRTLEMLGEELDTGTAFAAPQTELESVLAHIWQAAMDMPRIGLHDNFFDLGINSLQMIVIEVELEKQGLLFGDLEVYKAIHNYPTIQAFAAFIAAKAQARDAAASEGVRG